MLLLQACEDPSILKIVAFIKLLMQVLFIVIPVGLIVVLSIDFFKAIISSDEDQQKKVYAKSFKRLLSAVIMFLVPLIVNLVIGLLDNSQTISDNITSCWTNANADDIKKYQVIQDQKDSCLDSNGIWNDTSNSCNIQNNTNNNTNTDNTDTNNNISTDTIYVGDSRTVGMCGYVSLKDTEKCVAESGKGLTWFQNTAKSSVNTILNSNPNTTYKIVINLGVNDLGNKSSYVSTYNSLISTWSKHKIIIVSVTPVDEQKEKTYGYSVTNSSIEDFNSIIKNGINSQISYCDIYSSIKYTTTDGVHYDSSTYQKIYSAINNCK